MVDQIYYLSHALLGGSCVIIGVGKHLIQEQLPGDIKSIKVTKSTYERITRRISYYGETLDQILTRVLDSLDDYEQQKQSKNHKK